MFVNQQSFEVTVFFHSSSSVVPTIQERHYYLENLGCRIHSCKGLRFVFTLKTHQTIYSRQINDNKVILTLSSNEGKVREKKPYKKLGNLKFLDN